MRGAGLCSPLPCGLPVGVTAAVPMSSAHLGGPSWGGSNGPLAGLSLTPYFQGKAWVLSPWPGFHCG